MLSPRADSASAAWRRLRLNGDMDFLTLKNRLPFSTTSFAVPNTASPKPWDRVAVPATISRLRNRKIHKRAAGPIVRRFDATAAELDSHGFGQRKRVRPNRYVPASRNAGFSGLAIASNPSREVAENLKEARGVVFTAERYAAKRLAELDALLLNLGSKRPSAFPEEDLKWVPHKRHNTRWPVESPNQHVSFETVLKPLSAMFEAQPEVQEMTDKGEDPQETKQLDNQQMRRRSTRRLSKRPSLPPVTEDSAESPVYPGLSPMKKTAPISSSPIKRWPASNKFFSGIHHTVSSSPVKEFTITATPQKVSIQPRTYQKVTVEDASESETSTSPIKGQPRHGILSPASEGSEGDHEDIPNGPTLTFKLDYDSDTESTYSTRSPTKRTDTTSHVTVAADMRNAFMPSSTYKLDYSTFSETESVYSKSPSKNSVSSYATELEESTASNKEAQPNRPSLIFKATSSVNSSLTSRSTIYFDAPTSIKSSEPEHELRRRVSFDNARRSDKPLPARAKRLFSWVANHQASSRRHSSFTPGMPVDVDVKNNLDIFGADRPATTITTLQVDEPTVEERIVAQLESPTIQVVKEDCSTVILENEPAILMEDAPTVQVEEDEPNIALEDSAMGDYPADPIEDAPRDISPGFKPINRHDDETDILRNFVARNKAAKAQQKRPRTSEAGSPLSKLEPAAAITGARLPLGEKDHNKSPTPSKSSPKKRKLVDAIDMDINKENTSRLMAPDLDDSSPQPQAKRRRKNMEVETNSILNPDFAPGQDLTAAGPGVRRSSRNNNNNNNSRLPAALAALSVMSSIPVRLPGSGNVPTVITFGNGMTAEEKRLGAVTRGNTLKNKFGAAFPQATLAKMARKAARESPVKSSSSGTESPAAAAAAAARKSVRWDETLERVQGEEEPAVAAVPSPVIPAPAEEKRKKKKKPAASAVLAAATPRRTRASTLPPAAPASASASTTRIGKVTKAGSRAVTGTSTPAKSAAAVKPKPKSAAGAGASVGRSAAATRIATPARRRTARSVSGA